MAADAAANHQPDEPIAGGLAGALLGCGVGAGPHVGQRDGLALQVGNQVPHLVAGTREEEGGVISNYNDKFNC